MKRLVSVVLLLCWIPSFAQRQHLIFESSFEDSTLSDWSSVQRCFVDRVSTTTSIAKVGSRAGRFYSKALDSLGCPQVRSQVLFNDTSAVNFERWYGVSVYLGTGYPLSYDGVEFFLEFLRPDTLEGYAPLGVGYHGYATGVGIWPSGQYVTSYGVRRTPPPASPYTIYINPLSAVQLNKWFDLVMRVKWANDTSGRIRIWLNDTLRYSYNGITNYGPNQLRLGLDKWDWRLHWQISTTQERTLYLDEFRIGDALATYADVKPGTMSALPIRFINPSWRIKSNCVQLFWQAISSEGFLKFIVERNTGSGWSPIGEVRDNGSNDYLFLDCSPSSLNQYRIRGISSRSEELSKILWVRFSAGAPLRVAVYNLLGQLITTQTVTRVDDLRQTLGPLPSGIYLVRFENGMVQKIVF